MKKKIEEIAPGKNLTPVWMAENLDTVTSHPLPLDSRAAGKFSFTLKLRQKKHCFLSAQLTNLFFGVDQSDCPIPCVTFSTEVKYLSTMDSYPSGIQLNFLPTVEVIKCLVHCTVNHFWMQWQLVLSLTECGSQQMFQIFHTSHFSFDLRQVVTYWCPLAP